LIDQSSARWRGEGAYPKGLAADFGRFRKLNDVIEQGGHKHHSNNKDWETAAGERPFLFLAQLVATFFG